MKTKLLGMIAAFMVLSFGIPIGAAPVDLLKNVKPEMRNVEDGKKIEMAWTFNVENPEMFSCLTLDKPLDPTLWTLNGKEIPFPLKNVRFTEVSGIPSPMLKNGENNLKLEYYPKDKKTLEDVPKWAIRLYGMREEDLEFTTGPVLGICGTDYFTVSCRTNMPAKVTAKSGKMIMVSEEGLFHFFKFTGLKPGEKYDLLLTAASGKFSRDMDKFTAHTLGVGNEFRFIALGDSRTNPDDWVKVTDAVLKNDPAFVIHSGDMVVDGKSDPLWNKDLFGPSKKLFSSIPVFPVLGNHEGNSPVYHKFFAGGENQLKNWTVNAGACLFIGIDGDLNWSSGSENYKWLENILSASKDKFIFLTTHYPPWSSGPHGAMVDGKVKERQASEARHCLMPMLKKYNATVLIAGHDHFYERSEPDDGITVIITGGAGAPRYDKSAKGIEQNPWSKAFSKKLNYCIFDIKDDTCKMTALAPDGEKLDEKEFKARK